MNYIKAALIAANLPSMSETEAHLASLEASGVLSSGFSFRISGNSPLRHRAELLGGFTEELCQSTGLTLLPVSFITSDFDGRRKTLTMSHDTNDAHRCALNGIPPSVVLAGEGREVLRKWGLAFEGPVTLFSRDALEHPLAGRCRIRKLFSATL